AFMRFEDISLPEDAIITEAYLKLSLDSTYGPTHVRISATNADNSEVPELEADADNGIKTSSFADWQTNTYPSPGDSFNTPDIAAVIQEVIDRPGWQAGNSILFWLDHIGSSEDEGIDIAATENES